MGGPIDLGDLLAFLSRSSSWTCTACGKYGTGFASWREHRDASPDCVTEQDDHVHVTAGPPDAAGPVADPADTLLPMVRWWTVVDVDGREIRLKRRPYVPGDVWIVYGEAERLHSLAFAATRDGPLLWTVPVGREVRRGDRILLPAASGGQVSVAVDTRTRAVCQLPGCGCSGEAHA